MKSSIAQNENNWEELLYRSVRSGREEGRLINRLTARLYDQYYSMACQKARQFGLDSVDAWDILQDAVIVLMEKITTGHFEFRAGAGFAPFFQTTFFNLASNYRKKYKLDKKADVQVGDIKDTMPENTAAAYCDANNSESPDKETELLRIMKKYLTETGYLALYLSYIKQKSNTECAVIMKYKSEKVFRQRKHVYLKMLSKKITNRERDILVYLAA